MYSINSRNQSRQQKSCNKINAKRYMQNKPDNKPLVPTLSGKCVNKYLETYYSNMAAILTSLIAVTSAWAVGSVCFKTIL